MIYCLLHLYFVYAVYTPLITETPKHEKNATPKDSPFRVAPVKIRLSVSRIIYIHPSS